MNDCSFDSLSSYWGVEYIQGWYIIEEYTCTRTYISKKNTYFFTPYVLFRPPKYSKSQIFLRL